MAKTVRIQYYSKACLKNYVSRYELLLFLDKAIPIGHIDQKAVKLFS